MYDAIVLAGGENNEPLQQYSGACYEALIDIHGEPMVLLVVRALRACPEIGKILVVGPAEHLKKYSLPEGVEIIACANLLTKNTLLGLHHLKPKGKILVATSDIPLLTAQAVTDFIAKAKDQDADMCYPIVPKELNEKMYPDMRRTYVRIREGTFTGGNLFFVESACIPGAIKAAEGLIERRKQPLRMCKILGWGFVLKFLLRRLSLPELEQRVSVLLGLRGKAIISNYPEVGLDVDKPSDLQLVRSSLARLYNKPSQGGPNTLALSKASKPIER